MRPRLLLLPMLFGAAPLAAQNYALDKCDHDKAAVGYLHGTVTVGYTLGKNGVPDTGSVVVLQGAPLGAAALRSAAVRQLAACKMKHPEAAGAVTQEVRFDSANVALAPAQPFVGTWTPLPVTAADVDTVRILDAKDSTIEERPRWISTDRPPHTQPVTTSGRTSGADASMFASSSSMNTGMVTANLVVGTDGRVVKDSVALVSSDNPANSSNLLRALAASRFAPARITGLPVRSRVVATIIVGPGGFSVVLLPGARSVLNAR